MLGTTKIDFLGARKVTFVISAILAVVGLVAAIAIPTGMARLGIDFSGGVSIQFRFNDPVAIEKVRDILGSGGFEDANLQTLSDPTKLLVRLKSTEEDLSATRKAIAGAFREKMPENPFIIDSTSEVGPTVGKKLQTDALKAIGIALLGILFYVAWRFEFRFGVAAVIATFHDVLVVLGLLFILNKEMNLLIVTALLTLAGYSLTDSVVVFDRIRENLHKKKREDFYSLVNRSINEVLSRTVVTSLTTLIVLGALILFGGEVIHDFALALFLGVVVGTYSSMFIASPVLLLWKERVKGAPNTGALEKT
ncbi:MAG: protein translocase subunit SecF [Thermodesulfobacteriota bacterium]